MRGWVDGRMHAMLLHASTTPTPNAYHDTRHTQTHTHTSQKQRNATCLVPPPDALPDAVREVALGVPLLRQQEAPAAISLLFLLALLLLLEEPGDCVMCVCWGVGGGCV